MPPTRKIPSRLETDPKKMLERLIGLPEIIVLGLWVFRHALDYCDFGHRALHYARTHWWKHLF
jgi:hypothetical protein